MSKSISTDKINFFQKEVANAMKNKKLPNRISMFSNKTILNKQNKNTNKISI